MRLSYIFLLTGFLFSCQVSAMEEDDKSQGAIRIRQSSSEQKKDIKEETNTAHRSGENQEEKKCCNHWGLSHCFAGIGEYFWRTLLCGYGFDYQHTDRAWAYYGSNNRVVRSSDCLIMGPCDELVKDTDGCDSLRCCDNPIYGIICAPYMVTHLLCELPYYIYHSAPNQRPGVSLFREFMCVQSLNYICTGERNNILGLQGTEDAETVFGVKNDEAHEYYVWYSCCLNERILKYRDPSLPDDGGPG